MTARAAMLGVAKALRGIAAAPHAPLALDALDNAYERLVRIDPELRSVYHSDWRAASRADLSPARLRVLAADYEALAEQG